MSVNMSMSDSSRRRSRPRGGPPPVRPTTPTILFENMNQHQRESYAKNLLLRQQARRQPAPAELWRADETLYAQPGSRAQASSFADQARQSSTWSAGSSMRSLPSASRGARPAPIGPRNPSAQDVSSSFAVAETGDSAQVSRGGSTLSYGTAPTTGQGNTFRHDTGGRTFVTGSLEPPQFEAPPAALPFPVLWQLHAHPSELDPALQPMGADSAIEGALAMAHELRHMNGAPREGAAEVHDVKKHSSQVLRQVRGSRHRTARAVLQAKQRERLDVGSRRLRAHSRDPGAESRPAPTAGRRAAPPPGAVGPGWGSAAQPPRDGRGAPVGPIPWDGVDAVLGSGPAATPGQAIPLQYLELVRMGDGDDAAPPEGAFQPSSNYAMAKPGMRYAGGGFAKTRPEKQHTQEDYVELLRVAEVLEALNAVEGAVLQEHPQHELLSYEQYLTGVMADGSRASVAEDERGNGGTHTLSHVEGSLSGGDLPPQV